MSARLVRCVLTPELTFPYPRHPAAAGGARRDGPPPGRSGPSRRAGPSAAQHPAEPHRPADLADGPARPPRRQRPQRLTRQVASDQRGPARTGRPCWPWSCRPSRSRRTPEEAAVERGRRRRIRRLRSRCWLGRRGSALLRLGRHGRTGRRLRPRRRRGYLVAMRACPERWARPRVARTRPRYRVDAGAARESDPIGAHGALGRGPRVGGAALAALSQALAHQPRRSTTGRSCPCRGRTAGSAPGTRGHRPPGAHQRRRRCSWTGQGRT